jgi:hypothetical protein
MNSNGISSPFPYSFTGVPLVSAAHELERDNLLMQWKLTNYELVLPGHRMVNQLSARHTKFIAFRDNELETHTMLLSSYIRASYSSIEFENSLSNEVDLLKTYFALRQSDFANNDIYFDYEVLNLTSDDQIVPSIVILPFVTMVLRSVRSEHKPTITVIIDKPNSEDSIRCRINAPDCFMFNFTDAIGVFKEAGLVRRRESILQRLLGTTFISAIEGDSASSTAEKQVLLHQKNRSVALDITIPLLTPERLKALGIASGYDSLQLRQLLRERA